MIGGSIPKLLQIAGETKEALGKISADLPADVSVAEVTAKIADLESAVSELDALNAEPDAPGQCQGGQGRSLE